MSTLMLTGLAIIFILIGMMLMVGILMLINYLVTQEKQIQHNQDVLDTPNPYQIHLN